MAVHHRQVALGDLAALERLRQAPMCLRGLGEDDHAARPPIQPMDDVGARADVARHPGVQRRIVIDPAAGGRGHPRRLIDGHHPLVLVQDARAHSCWIKGVRSPIWKGRPRPSAGCSEASQGRDAGGPSRVADQTSLYSPSIVSPSSAPSPVTGSGLRHRASRHHRPRWSRCRRTRWPRRPACRSAAAPRRAAAWSSRSRRHRSRSGLP